MNESRLKLQTARRWVVKLGSALLTDQGCGLKIEALDDWVAQIVQLKQRGIDVVIVSSGAVAEGVSRLGWGKRPRALHELQAAAAVGQMGLIQAYEFSFQKYGMRTAQILLTHDAIADRERYLNARSTLRTLVDLNVIPVINENDTVATDEIRFGDNDTLAGLVANLVEADLLVLLTDQPGLYDADPNSATGARLINEAKAGDPELEKYCGSGGPWGRGGMLSKLWAAATAARSGAHTVIASGLEKNILLQIADGREAGTLLRAEQAKITARKQWLASNHKVHGTLVLDEGAVAVLQEKGRSLLPVGVREITGEFSRGEIVSCRSEDGREIARGLVNYNAADVRKIIGKSSDRIEALLGYVDEPELIHRDNLILIP
ncbi:MAG: glutamate 5-kinase [Gammaproteobacteria bacterium RIFCSPLOWO2_12_FULL_52_10]|nr:MAG: glutamate 5-kinase [Gammaproteobacteria bacterium RIFCSPLOWO2_12_FULL_52_10]